MNFSMILIVWSVVSVFLILFLLWKLYSFSLIIIDIEDSIDESLVELNKRYLKMSEILEKPVFFDSIEVRQVIADIEASRATILKIAQSLTKDMEEEIDGQIKKESSEKE